MWFPRSGPHSGCDSMNHATSVFSLPLSEHTLDERPNFSTADWNASKAVLALLFVEHRRNTIIREIKIIKITSKVLKVALKVRC